MRFRIALITMDLRMKSEIIHLTDPMSTSGHVAIELNESSFGMMRNSV